MSLMYLFYTQSANKKNKQGGRQGARKKDSLEEKGTEQLLVEDKEMLKKKRTYSSSSDLDTVKLRAILKGEKSAVKLEDEKVLFG